MLLKSSGLLKNLTSAQFVFFSSKMKVYPIPCLQDNYAYLLVDESTNQAAAIDPVAPTEVLDTAKKLNVDIKMLLTTHHHWDHASGNLRFTQACKVPVVGGDDRIEALSNKVVDGDILKLGNIQIRAIATPCHTRGSISYYCSTDGASALFSGDTLFIAGCGRFFEGDAANMHTSLSKLAKLPPETEVYCGHEYTHKDLKFAQSVEPGNRDIQNMIQAERSCTVPTTLREIMLINPFLRMHSPELQKSMGLTDPIELMHELRQSKNKF